MDVILVHSIGTNESRLCCPNPSAQACLGKTSISRAEHSISGPKSRMTVSSAVSMVAPVEDLVSLSDSDLNDMASRFGMPLGHRQRFINYIKMLQRTNGA